MLCTDPNGSGFLFYPQPLYFFFLVSFLEVFFCCCCYCCRRSGHEYRPHSTFLHCEKGAEGGRTEHQLWGCGAVEVGAVQGQRGCNAMLLLLGSPPTRAVLRSYGSCTNLTPR